MGLFGGSSRSTSNNSTTTIDRKVGLESDASLIQSEGGDINYYNTSEEAVALGTAYADVANEIADGAFRSSERIIQDGLDTAGGFAALANQQSLDAHDLSFAALDTVSTALQGTQDAARREESQLADKIVTLGIPVLALVLIFRGFKK